MPNNLTICLAGSTGAVGNKVLNFLNEESQINRIITLTRKPASYQLSKEENHVVDFNQLASLKNELKADVFICCLGTTIKVAGSQAAFKKVDLDYVVEFGQLAENVSAQKFLVISSLGADPQSSIFYSRIKGEMEQSIKKLNIPSIEIFQPSLLLGERSEHRPGEAFAKILTYLMNPLLLGPLKKYRGIQIETVAKALCKRALNPENVRRTYTSDQIATL